MILTVLRCWYVDLVLLLLVGLPIIFEELCRPQCLPRDLLSYQTLHNQTYGMNVGVADLGLLLKFVLEQEGLL